MATSSDGKTFSVIKFASSGLVALCAEVVELVNSGEATRYRLDLKSARYERDQWGDHTILFDYLPPEESA